MVSCKLVLLCVIVFVVAAASALPQGQTERSRSAQVKQEEVGHNLYVSALTQRQKDYG